MSIQGGKNNTVYIVILFVTWFIHLSVMINIGSALIFTLATLLFTDNDMN